MWFVDQIKRNPAGKPDYRWAKAETESREADDHNGNGAPVASANESVEACMRSDLADKFGIEYPISDSLLPSTSRPRSAAREVWACSVASGSTTRKSSKPH